MRVLLSAYGSRGDVGPVAGLAVLRSLGAEVRARAGGDRRDACRSVAMTGRALGEGTNVGLINALTTWFGPPTAA